MTELTDEQIINSMINYYRNRGLNVTGVLDNPIFTKLPTRTKVEIIKQHAAALASGGNGFTGAEKRDLAVSALMRAVQGGALGLSAGTIASTALGVPRDNKFSLIAGATLATIGAGAGLALQASQISSKRKAYAEALRRVKESPTNETALGALFTSTAPASSNILGGTLDSFSKDFSTHMNSLIPSTVEGVHKDLHDLHGKSPR